jgi:hypothetical protein
MPTDAQALIETIKALPGVRIAEVEDFLDVFSAKTRRQAGPDMTAPTGDAELVGRGGEATQAHRRFEGTQAVERRKVAPGHLDP